MQKVLILMGSDSDLTVMKGAADALAECGISYEIRISSAHRTPERTAQIVKEAEAKGVKVIIAGAGLAAHLPGVVAAYTTLPVIGVPIQGGALSGVDALYAIVQMPKGIPVATVAVNGAYNAGLLAAEMLAIADQDVKERLVQLRRRMAEEVERKDRSLAELGIENYLVKK
ncbi:5-(carboxyamino)imidazole ribonucleotide mutase [Thermicanus aegyptius]|uniref:5-(carboxyamino)imidazole ribonucleotide mutase n=1 Tax=Thermicanus aegyptius TaxID=94009 RepID=UPI00041FF181|nr:5-(carboxyamino)imidazole ribonucleotide mutase [Thermicanus aegyptius]